MSRPSTGSLRGALLREGLLIARSQPVASLVTALVLALVCGVTLSTTGQSAAAEARVLQGIDEGGTRVIVVEDADGEGRISATSVARVAALSDVEWVLGLGPVLDVRNAAIATASSPVPARVFYGQLPAEVRTGGRAPDAGEALVGREAWEQLGLVHAAGGVTSETLDAAVVGSFSAANPLQFLDRSVLIAPPAAEEGNTSIRDAAAEQPLLRAMYVMVSDVHRVDAITTALRDVIESQTSQYSVATPAELVEIRAVVADELGASSRRLMLVILGVGLLIIAVTLTGAVSQRRRDFGRRRALGATRSAIAVLVLTQTAAASVLGAAVGVAVGLIVVRRLAGSLPSPAFVLGVTTLAILAGLVAALPPACLAATRDPVRILRVP